MFTVYVLKSLKDNKRYIGYSKNLERRIIEHNSGKVKSTKNRFPLEVTPNADLKLYKRNALIYGKRLRGEYVNKNSGEKIILFRNSIQEVLQHDYKDKEHLQSVAAIPKIIEDSIFIQSLPLSEKQKKRSDLKSYDYYLAGLKIDGEDYTVRSAIAVMTTGDMYYDHKLTKIEKGRLLSMTSRITNPEIESNSAFNKIKDRKLLSILQVGKFNLDENGEPILKSNKKNSSGLKASYNSIGTKGLQERINAKKDFKESDLDNVTRLRDIGKNLSKNIGMKEGKDIRTGRKMLKRFGNMLGFYAPQTGLIRLKNINDVSTLAHEIGHKLDFELFDTTNNLKFDKGNKLDGIVTRANGVKNPKTRQKILDNARIKYGTENVDALLDRAILRQELKAFGSRFGRYFEKLEESIAEFVSNYVVNPDVVRKSTPKFLDFFENLLDVNPEIKNALLEARKQVKEFKSQDPRQITESTIVRDDETDGYIKAVTKGLKGFYSNIVDGTQAFRKLEDKLMNAYPTLKGDENPLKQVLSLIGVDGKAKQFLENHPFVKRGNDVEILKDIKPFFEIFSKMLKDGTLKSHEGYLTALRNIELIKNGKVEASTTTKGIAEETAKLYEDELGKEYLNDLVDNLRKYNGSLLDYYADAGKLSKKQLQEIKELNQYYVPFKTYFDEWESSGQMPNVSKYVRDSSPNAVRGIKGSQREIVSPIGSIIKNTYDIIASADRNNVLNIIVESLQKIDKTLVQEIPARVFKQVKVIADNDKADFTENKVQVAYQKPNNAEIITVFKDGKPKYYEIPKEYYNSFMAVNEPVSKAVKILSIPSINNATVIKYK